MNKAVLTICAAVLSGLVWSCSILQSNKPQNVTMEKDGNEAVTTEVPQTVAIIDKVLYGKWVAQTVGETAVEGDERPYVVFDTTVTNPFIAKVYANNGCNTLNGQVAVTPGGEMKPTSKFQTTMRFCPNSPYELGVNVALNSVASYKIRKIGTAYSLSLLNGSGKTMMTLMKNGISFINGAWTVTKVGDQSVSADKGLKLVIDVPELKIHGNGGCNVINGHLFIDPAVTNSIQFRDLISTKMYCPDLELEQAFLVALEQVETASADNGGDTVCLKNADGETVIGLQRLNLKQQQVKKD